MADTKMNEVVDHLIDTTYKELKKRNNGRTPSFDGVQNVIKLIVTNNYKDCLQTYLDKGDN